VRPRFTGWFSHPEPFAFDIDEFDPPPDARRLQNGTPAIPAYYAALPGLKIVREIGIDRIRAASQSLTMALLAEVDRRGFASVAPRDPARLSGTVALNVPDAAGIARTLNARDFVVDYRPGVGIRLSPHFYNTLDEVAAIMEEISRSVVRSRTP
jgi:kynureninase